MTRQKKAQRAQRGGILVQVLVIIAALLALMATLVANQRVTLHAQQTILRTGRAEAAVRSGLARAEAVLSAANANLVTKNDDWALQGNKGDESFELDTNDTNTTFRMEIVDAASLININTAPEAQLQQLPILTEQVDCLLDWREPSAAARPDGAKDSYYNNLSTPYNTKLGNLNSVSELLLVSNWTANDLYTTNTGTTSTSGIVFANASGTTLPLVAFLTTQSGAPNTTVTGAARTNLNLRTLNPAVFTQIGIPATTAATLVARAPFTSFAQVLTVPGLAPNVLTQLLDSATFAPGTRLVGKINVNTASESVLETIPNVSTATAQAIVAQQSTGFTALGDLQQVSGLVGIPLAQLADATCVGSDTWIVRIWGESGPENDRVTLAVEATVGIRNQKVQVLSWERLASKTIPAWWDWNTDAGTSVDANTATR